MAKDSVSGKSHKNLDWRNLPFGGCSGDDGSDHTDIESKMWRKLDFAGTCHAAMSTSESLESLVDFWVSLLRYQLSNGHHQLGCFYTLNLMSVKWTHQNTTPLAPSLASLGYHHSLIQAIKHWNFLPIPPWINPNLLDSSLAYLFKPFSLSDFSVTILLQPWTITIILKSSLKVFYSTGYPVCYHNWISLPLVKLVSWENIRSTWCSAI